MLQAAAEALEVRPEDLRLDGMATTPWRSRPAEQVLLGAAVDDALPSRAAEAALAEAQPVAHDRYKVPLARALLSRALKTLLAADP